MSPIRTLLLAITLLLAGCAQPMTPAELAKNEAHDYPGHSKAEVFKASVEALQTLGFEVVTKDPASGRIKTAPKLVTVTAYGDGTTAVAAANSVAWTLEVSDASGGANLHAEPRGYSAGQAVGPEHMNGAYLERSFATLYSEIQSNLAPSKPVTDASGAKEEKKAPAPKKDQKSPIVF